MASFEETATVTTSSTTSTSFDDTALNTASTGTSYHAAAATSSPLAGLLSSASSIITNNNNNNTAKIGSLADPATSIKQLLLGPSTPDDQLVALDLSNGAATVLDEKQLLKSDESVNSSKEESIDSGCGLPSAGDSADTSLHLGLYGLVSGGESSPTASKSNVSASSSAGGNMFSEVFEGKAGDLDAGPLEDNYSSASDGCDRNCKLCSSRLVSPRVLSCLHVFCEACLKKLLNDDSSSSSSSSLSSLGGSGVDAKSPKTHLECPLCKQSTKLGPKGVESLMCDYILTNILDLSTIESELLSCTSCKSKEKAISRCSDCANFLCGGCDNAHKYMRCFENHEVLKLEDLQKAAGGDKPMTIHKPLFCANHPAENLKYYCFNCQVPVCNDCLIADHKGSEHHYDVMAVAEQMVRGDVENLMKEAHSKTQYCDAGVANLSQALNELQAKHDNARDTIEDTYQMCKKILEKCRDQSLSELDSLHSERELKIMDLLQNMANTMGKIDSTCKFTKRVLEQANAAEFLSMKKLIASQFVHLINNTPKCDVNYSLMFDSNVEKFEQLAQEVFGKFRTESTPPSPKECTPPPTLPGMPPSGMMSAGVPGGRNMLNSSASSHGGGHVGSSVTASSPISMPNSMQSSFDGDLSVLGNNFMMPNVLAPTPDSPSQVTGSGMHHGSTAALQQHQQQQQQHMQQSQGSAGGHMNGGPAGFNGVVGSGGGAGHGVGPAGLVGSGQGGPGNSINGLIGPGAGGVAAALKAGGGGGPNVGGQNGGGGLNLAAINGPAGVGLNGAGGPNGVASLNAVSNGVGVPNNGGVPPTYNSILEYNLSRLASMTEAMPDVIADPLVGGGPVTPANCHHGHHNQAVVPATGSDSPPLCLVDLLGDARAISNLHALAKMNFNNNDYNTDNQFIANGSSTGIDCLLPDFCLPAAPSPSMPQLPPLAPGPVSDMALSNFHANATPGSASIVTGRNKAIPMQIRCKFGALGTSKGQFNSPHGFCLGVDEEIIVADTNNHRIEVFDKTGTMKFMFGVPGKEEGQLWYPRKVAVMHTSGKFVVCDRGNERSRMQVFSKCGHFMRKIVIRYIDIVAGLAVTSKGHIVAVDSVSPTVFVISEDGELVRWFDCSDFMREPSDIAIRDNDFYVCDFKGHCVAVFQEDGTFQYRIGNEKVTCFPNGIDISNDGDILIGDSHGNRFHVACYSRDGILQSEYECPHVKVSRCCGLKITSEGYVVTLAKNNHHVLVLNTLYVH